MHHRIHVARAIALAATAAAASACTIDDETVADVEHVEHVENVSAHADALSADADASGAEPAWSSTCYIFQRGLLGDVEDATIYLESPYYNEGATPSIHVGTASLTKLGLLRFDLDSFTEDTMVVWAGLGLAQQWSTHDTEILLHRALAPWFEDTVTWSSFAEAYESGSLASFATTGNGFSSHEVNVSGIVSAWVAGALPNYGFVIAQPGGSNHAFRSSDHPNQGFRPYLRVCVARGQLEAGGY